MSAFSTLSIVCVGASAGWPVRHVCSAACSQQTQGGSHHVACAGLSCTDSEPALAALRPQTVQILAPHSAFVVTEPVTCTSQRVLNSIPGAVERFR